MLFWIRLKMFSLMQFYKQRNKALFLLLVDLMYLVVVLDFQVLFISQIFSFSALHFKDGFFQMHLSLQYVLAYLEFSQFFSFLVIVFFFFSWCRDGCNAFVMLFLLKELILIKYFILRVSSEVFNLSFCHFLSLSLWLIYHEKL